MRVGVAGLDFDGVRQMLDRFFELANFVEDAAEIEMADGVARIKSKRGAKRIARSFQFAKLEEKAAQINVRLGPIRLHFNHAAVETHGFVEFFGMSFGFQRLLEQVFGGSRVHLAKIGGARENVVREEKLSGQRFDGLAFRSWRNRRDLPAAWK